MSQLEIIYRNNITTEIPLLGRWQFPPILGTDDIPTDLIGFNHAMTCKDKSKTIHFYIDDYQFDRVWNRPDTYIPILAQYRSCLTPDFSLYRDMPLAAQIYNVFRSRVIGYLMEQRGIKVIPTLQWSDEASFEFCFDGLPQHKVVSVSTVGVNRDGWGKILWAKGMRKALEILRPKAVIHYGNDIGFDFGCVDVVRVKAFDGLFRKKEGAE